MKLLALGEAAHIPDPQSDFSRLTSFDDCFITNSFGAKTEEMAPPTQKPKGTKNPFSFFMNSKDEGGGLDKT